jgi:hypothetical protein
MSDRKNFKSKFNAGEDILIQTDDNKDIRKARLLSIGRKYIYFKYFKYDKYTGKYLFKYAGLDTLSISYEDINWQLYTIIKKGDPNYDKYFDEYINEIINSDDYDDDI